MKEIEHKGWTIDIVGDLADPGTLWAILISRDVISESGMRFGIATIRPMGHRFGGSYDQALLFAKTLIDSLHENTTEPGLQPPEIPENSE